MEANVLTFLGCDAAYEDASIVLAGAPFDSTTSFRPGARFGPSVIRLESDGIETFSPYQEADLCDISVFDAGDLPLSPGSSERSLDVIEAHTKAVLADGKFPFLVGGEHLVTLGAVRAFTEQWPDLHILHFDAHADLRDDYLGVSLSHACVMRRCAELMADPKDLHQFGIRSGDREEFLYAKDATDLHPFVLDDAEDVVENLVKNGSPVYLTVDLDVLDPSVLCGTGTPEAGGVTFLALLYTLLSACRANIVGADVVELAPHLDPSGASTATACKLIRELLLAIGTKGGNS